MIDYTASPFGVCPWGSKRWHGNFVASLLCMFMRDDCCGWELLFCVCMMVWRVSGTGEGGDCRIETGSGKVLVEGSDLVCGATCLDGSLGGEKRGVMRQ